MHLGVSKSLGVPVFALYEYSEKITKNDLTGQNKFKGQNQNMYILSNGMVIPHGVY